MYRLSTYVLDLIWGGTPTSAKVFYHSYLYHKITFILLSFNEKEKENKNLVRYVCVCEYINSLKKYSMKTI